MVERLALLMSQARTNTKQPFLPQLSFFALELGPISFLVLTSLFLPHVLTVSQYVLPPQRLSLPTLFLQKLPSHQRLPPDTVQLLSLKYMRDLIMRSTPAGQGTIHRYRRVSMML